MRVDGSRIRIEKVADLKILRIRYQIRRMHVAGSRIGEKKLRIQNIQIRLDRA